MSDLACWYLNCSVLHVKLCFPLFLPVFDHEVRNYFPKQQIFWKVCCRRNTLVFLSYLSFVIGMLHILLTLADCCKMLTQWCSFICLPPFTMWAFVDLLGLEPRTTLHVCSSWFSPVVSCCTADEPLRKPCLFFSSLFWGKKELRGDWVWFLTGKGLGSSVRCWLNSWKVNNFGFDSRPESKQSS